MNVNGKRLLIILTLCLTGIAQPGYADLHTAQDNPFTSMARQMSANTQQRTDKERDQGQLSLGRNFSVLGLNNDALNIYTQLATQTQTTTATRNVVWLEQAKLYIQQGNFSAAQNALANIKGDLNSKHTAEYKAIKARALLADGDTHPAFEAMQKISNASTWALYQAFNIAVTLLEKHNDKNGALLLHKIGRLNADKDSESMAIIDQANLTLGFSLLKLNKAKQARSYLEKVRLKSHLSDIALLGIGWSYSIENNHERALVFWLELVNRPYSSTYAYEAMLAVPYALSKASAYQQALQHYETAQQRINTDSDALDNTIKKINGNQFRKLISASPATENAWLEHWLDTPTTLAKHFLPLLLDNPEFQVLLREYRSLLQLEQQIRSMRLDIKLLEAISTTRQADSKLEKFYLRQQQLSRQTDKAIEQQLQQLQQQSLDIFARHRTQLAIYDEEIKLGMAQTIERSLFKAGDGS